MLTKGTVSQTAWNYLCMNVPVRITVFLVGGNVPSMRIVGLDSYDPGSVLARTLNVEVLLVVDVLERPTVVGLLNPPLRGEVRIRP